MSTSGWKNFTCLLLLCVLHRLPDAHMSLLPLSPLLLLLLLLSLPFLCFILGSQHLVKPGRCRSSVNKLSGTLLKVSGGDCSGIFEQSSIKPTDEPALFCVS